jgi:hypothetical protein
MKSRGKNRRRDARVTAIAAAALAPIFAVLATGTSLGQDTSKSDSSWERTESVLVVPPVYLPDTSTSADACAEDCPSSIPPAGSGTPIAVSGSADNESNASAGTADNPSDESVAVGGYAPDGSDWQEEQAAAARPQQGTGAPDNPLGSVQEYDERQAEAEQRGNYGAVQAPSVIIAVPAGAYAASGAASAPPPSPGAGVASSGVAASSPPFPSASWMPQPMARIAPLPPIVPHAAPQTMRVFPGGAFPGPGAGGFGAGFSQMPGFGGGFGHR